LFLFPSSPANGVISTEPFTERWITDEGETSNSQKYGDNHYYNYAPDGEDVTVMISPRFSSEYGFQSMPSLETLRAVSDPEVTLLVHSPLPDRSIIILLLLFVLALPLRTGPGTLPCSSSGTIAPETDNKRLRIR